MKYLITGGCGFLGSNIAERLLAEHSKVVIFDNCYRNGSERNRDWLLAKGGIVFIHGDIRNSSDVECAVKLHKPDVVYHLAGQVAMTTSINSPRTDFEINALGTFNLLNAVRIHSPHCVVVYSSTNKVYGDLEEFAYEESETRFFCSDYPDGFDENLRINFHSPYGCSKGCGDQYMQDFARIYGLRTVVFRHSTIYGGRQYSTVDQGWVGWFISKAIEIQRSGKPGIIPIAGNGKQVRDLLHSDDCVDLYLVVPGLIDKLQGQVFNVGGGPLNSSSILELFAFLDSALKITIEYQSGPSRMSDQKVFIANHQRISALTGWRPRVSKSEGIIKTLEWLAGPTTHRIL